MSEVLPSSPPHAPPRAAPLYVTVHLAGGLGNQMFEIAAALGYAVRASEVSDRALRVVLPPTTDQEKTRTRSYNAPGEILSRMPRGVIEVASKSEIFVHIEKPTFSFEEIPAPPPPATRVVVLRGYFQSTRYFDSDRARRAIYDVFKPFPDFEKRLADRYQWFSDRRRQRIAVHVRRGDYVRLQKIHNLLPPVYYAEAALALSGRLGASNPDEELQWVVFSDDIGWCKQSLPLRSARHACFIEDDLSDQDALWLMGACDHHIIANSSFSWWGAYLKELSDTLTTPGGPSRQVVVAPRQRFAPEFQANVRTTGLYNENWIVIG